MSAPRYAGIAALAFVISFVVTPLIIKLAVKYNILDKPGGRRVNKVPIPRPGGIAIFLALVSSVLILGPKGKGEFTSTLAILAGAAIIFMVGILDDRFDLPAVPKLLGHIGAAMTAWALGVRIYNITNPFSSEMENLPGALVFFRPWLSALVTTFWLVGMTNAMNFIDGLDGLTAGVSVITGITLFLVAEARGQIVPAAFACAMVGSALGFLRWNFHPAKIFMGDGGAYTLGFVLAAISVQGAFKSTASLALIMPVLALLVPILDTTLAVIRRVRRGKSPFAADREHLHHWLMDRGLGHRRTVIFLYLITAFLCVTALALAEKAALVPWFLGILTILVLGLVAAGKLVKLKTKNKNLDEKTE